MTLTDAAIDTVAAKIALQLDLTLARHEFGEDFLSTVSKRLRITTMARAYGYTFEEMEALIGVEWR